MQAAKVLKSAGNRVVKRPVQMAKMANAITPMAKIAYMFLYLILYLFLVLVLILLLVLFLILILYRRPHRPTMATRTTMTRRRPNSW